MKTTVLYWASTLLIGTLCFGVAYANVAPKPNTPALPQLESLQHDTPLELNIPKMQRFTTDNGVNAIFTQLHELPIIDISITFKGGSAKDDTIKKNGYGTAMMTALMSTQGTANMDENQIAHTAELLGMELTVTAWRDTFTYSFRSLSDDTELRPALALFAQIISSPSFDDKILKRNQEQMLLGFKAQKENPNQLAKKAFLKTIYGNHPYGTFSQGNPQSISAITRDDVLAYKNKYLVAQNAHISITGDLSFEEAKRIANELTALLPKGQRASDLPMPTTPTPIHVHIPYESTQTHIFIGHLGEKETKDPILRQEHTNFSLGNSVLAGSDFNAHLMKEVRDKAGYTYDISGGMTTYDERGYYLISFSTQTDNTVKAIDKTLATIKQTLANGINQDELELEKNARKYAYPMSLATNSAIHRTASTLNYDNLPDSHIHDYLTRLDNATQDGVNQALRRYLRPDEFVIVTIGKDKPDLSHLIPHSQIQSIDE